MKGLSDTAEQAGLAENQIAQNRVTVIALGNALRGASDITEGMTEGQKKLAAEMGLTGTAVAGFTSQVQEAHAALVKLKQIQAEAGAKFYTNEKELRAEIAALKGGEEAMRKYNEEKVRSKAWTDAYNQAIRSGMETLDATSEANRIAAMAVERYNLQLQRQADLKNARSGAREAERDEKAYERTAEALGREVEARRRVALATVAGGDALREANIQTQIATRLSQARADAGTAEAAAIERQVRELDKWDRVADAAALVNQTIEAGRSPLEQYRRQMGELTRAFELLQTNGVQMAAEDIEAFKRGLAELDPEIQALKELVTDVIEFPAEVADDPECIALFMEAVQ